MNKQTVSGTQLLFVTYQVSPEVTELLAVPDADELHKLVGGYLEKVPGFLSLEWKGAHRDCVALCNEDGKRLELPVNNWATVLWDRALRRAGHPGLVSPTGRVVDCLVGNVVVLLGTPRFMREL